MKAADSNEACSCSWILYHAKTFYTMHCCVRWVSRKSLRQCFPHFLLTDPFRIRKI